MKKYAIGTALIIIVVAIVVGFFLIPRQAEQTSIEYLDNGAIMVKTEIPTVLDEKDFSFTFSGEFLVENSLSKGGYTIKDIVDPLFTCTKGSPNFAFLFSDEMQTESNDDSSLTLSQPMEVYKDGILVGNLLVQSAISLDATSGEIGVLSSSADYSPLNTSDSE